MPNPFKALRRKSAGNVMDDENLADSAPTSSFRVLERKEVPRRPETKSSFNVIQVTRKSMSLDCVTSSPDGYRTSYGSSAVNSSRTQSNDASSFSARYSSSSTLPSPPEHAAFVAPDDDLFKPHEIPKPRAMPEYPTNRPALSSTLTDLDLGDDFDSDLFSGINKRESRAGDMKLPSRPPGAMARSQENLFGYNRRASPIEIDRRSKAIDSAPTSPLPDGTGETIKAQQTSNSASLTPSSNASLKTPSVSSASSMPVNDALSTLSTPRVHKGPRVSGDTHRSIEEEPVFDEATTLVAKHVVNQDSNGYLLPALGKMPNTQTSTRMKRLTAAEFAHMKQLEEPNYDTESEESDHEEEDDIDETEHLNRIKDQRRKQEESVARHRQQAMKVTGDRSSTMYSRLSLTQNSFSSPSLSLGLGQLKLGAEAGGNSGSSSDDDVPLGMLPLKKEANGRASVVGSIAGFRPVSYPARPGTSQGVSGPSGSTTKLPAFARNLPLDPPHPGQNLGQPGNRESMAFGGTGPRSVYGVPTGMGQGTTLVGQIETEERQRALRRGSPNAQIGFGLPSNLPAPQMQPQQRTMSFSGGMNFPQMMGGAPPMPPMPQMPVSADPLQQSQQRIAMLQQILNNQTQIYAQLMQQELLQTQQQFPQQMPQMAPMQDPRQSQYLGPPPQMRPMSIAPAGPRSSFARTMSMVNVAPPPPQHWSNPLPVPSMGGGLATPSLRNFGGNQGYAQSLAPSERSNIGTASRYRPVQNSLADGASTGASIATVQPGVPDLPSKNGGIFAKVKAIGSKRRGQHMTAESDESDDEDSWGKLKAGRGR